MQHHPDGVAQGTASLTITSVSQTGTSGTTQQYQLHGTLDATLPALTSSHANGTVTLHATF